VALIGAALTCFTAALFEIDAQADERTVTVCIDSRTVQESVMAQAIAGKMFADIGVRIEWHQESKCPAGQDGVIHISLNTSVSESRYPNALAIALPYEGVHIQVFIDRLRKMVDPIRKMADPTSAASLLAHVLTHEITHIVQGVNRHSESGVMKARWGQKDYEEMAWKPLNFTDEDVRLIHFGLHARAAGGPQVSSLAEKSAPAFAVQ
jgi:hypothetical protein